MLRKRIIPLLLLRGGGLVKTIRFDEAKYVGDPINAVKIFNEKEVDELIFLDIDASKSNQEPNFALIEDIASEAFMPFAYGGGVRNVEQMARLFSLGVEKVALNTVLSESLALLTEASRRFGAQSVVGVIDVKLDAKGAPKVFNHREKNVSSLDPVEWAIALEKAGAGEIVLNSVDKDGTMTGFDHDLIRQVAKKIRIPVVAAGGAASIEDMGMAVNQSGASAAAAGSLFVFRGKHRAVLITYPNQIELKKNVFLSE